MFLSNIRFFLTIYKKIRYMTYVLFRKEVGRMTRKAEKMTPRQFVKAFDVNKNNIQSAKIIPPQIGQKGFGKIAVVRKRSTYKIPSVNR